MILELILGFICLVFSYIIYNLTRKVEILEERTEFYETFINGVGNKIEDTQRKLKELDVKGSFEADDEIGFFFKYVKELQKEIGNFIGITSGENNNDKSDNTIGTNE